MDVDKILPFSSTLGWHSLNVNGADAYQWIGHPMRATLCRMRGGSILTGVGDKFLRLWSAETCKFMNEYHVPNAKALVDFDFDENKIVGLTSSQICIWRRSEPRSIFQSGGASFNHGLCMSFADPEVVIGCEDGRAFVYDMYSRSCSSIYRLHSSPVTCLTITDDQLILGGSTFGNVAIADQTSGQNNKILIFQHKFTHGIRWLICWLCTLLGLKDSEASLGTKSQPKRHLQCTSLAR